MSGPKYYSFSADSGEEAAGIFSFFSAFDSGVRATVSDNHIDVTVSSSAWSSGKDYDYFADRIAEARERFRRDEEMKRMLADGKENEIDRINQLKAQLGGQADEKRKKCLEAQSRCTAVARDAETVIDTPFGKYDLKDCAAKSKALLSEIRAELQGISAEREKCEKEAEKYCIKVRGCVTLTMLSELQNMAPDLKIPRTFLVEQTEDLAREVAERKTRLTAFTKFLKQLDSTITSKGLSEYRPRILKTLENLDPFSPSSVQTLTQLVEQIERENAYMQQRLKINKAGEAAVREAEEQGAALAALKSMLKPLAEEAERHTQSEINYEKLGRGAAEECTKITDEIEGLEFCSRANKSRLAEAKSALEKYSAALRSPEAYSRLSALLSKLRYLREDCLADEQNYKKFSAEYERYKGLYMKLRGILSAKDSELVDTEGYLEEPSCIVFNCSDAEEQLKFLAERNDGLEKVVNESRQRTFISGMSAMLQGSKWGREFRRERREDGSLHLSYVRPADKGVMFDVSCMADGTTAIVPRGVLLSNGRAAISAEALKKVHSSCAWADEIGRAFEQVGIPGGKYEEMGEEYREQLYKRENYYAISSDEQSLRYLKMSGFTEEEIAALGYGANESEESEQTESEETRRIANAKEIKPGNADR